MTPEDILEAAQLELAGLGQYVPAAANFAIEMVRRHNKECREEAAYYAVNSPTARSIQKAIEKIRP